jgi:transposase
MAGGACAHFAGSALMHPGCQIEQVYLCREPIDFRKAINGLSVMVEQELGLNPFGSALYVFVNRSRNKIKVLYWHRNGFCLWQKRLEEEKFHWPKHGDLNTLTVTIREFEWLLEGIDLWRNKPHKTLNFACIS